LAKTTAASVTAVKTTWIRNRVPMIVSSGRSASIRRSMCQCGVSARGSRLLLIRGSRQGELADQAQRLKPRARGRGRVRWQPQADQGQPHVEIGDEKLEVDRGAERLLEPPELGRQVGAEQRADRLAGLHFEIIDRRLEVAREHAHEPPAVSA